MFYLFLRSYFIWLAFWLATTTILIMVLLATSGEAAVAKLLREI
jgi:hypothetical protein